MICPNKAMQALSSFMPTDHRPWPVPQRSWHMWMDWDWLAFLHWPLPPELVEPLIPAPLRLDTFAGQAWIGVVPFVMRNVRPRYMPALPWVSFFAELNVRTYVSIDNKPGVWFWSLDAANPLAVRTARTFFHLPYFDARMRWSYRGETVRYSSVRTHRGAAAAQFEAVYRPDGAIYRAQPGTLDHWLTERYCLYSVDDAGQVWRGDVQHQPWPLQPAAVMIDQNSLTDALGLPLQGAPHSHFVRHLRVLGWLPEAV